MHRGACLRGRQLRPVRLLSHAFELAGGKVGTHQQGYRFIGRTLELQRLAQFDFSRFRVTGFEQYLTKQEPRGGTFRVFLQGVLDRDDRGLVIPFFEEFARARGMLFRRVIAARDHQKRGCKDTCQDARACGGEESDHRITPVC